MFSVFKKMLNVRLWAMVNGDAPNTSIFYVEWQMANGVHGQNNTLYSLPSIYVDLFKAI